MIERKTLMDTRLLMILRDQMMLLTLILMT